MSSPVEVICTVQSTLAVRSGGRRRREPKAQVPVSSTSCEQSAGERCRRVRSLSCAVQSSAVRSLYLPACGEATGATRMGPRRSSGRTRSPSDQSLSEVDSGVLAGSSAPRRAAYCTVQYCILHCTHTHGTGATRGRAPSREQTGGLTRTGAETRRDETRRALLNVPSRTLDVQLIGRRAARVVAESERCTALTTHEHNAHSSHSHSH